MKNRLLIVAALIVAATTLIFSNAKARVTSQNGQVVMVWGVIASNKQAPSSMADLLDWKASNRVFEELGAYVPGNLELTTGGKSETVTRASVSANFFSILGVKPQLGREFIAAEDQPGGAQVVILSHDVWQNRLRSDPAVVGKTITLNHETYTVVGIMPRGFQFPASTEVWTPLALEPGQLDRSTRLLNVLARLKPGVSVDQAQAEMNDIARQLQQRHPDTNSGWGINLSLLNVR